jgi:hypothetical protein
MDPDQIKKTGEFLTREEISRVFAENERREQSWVNRHYMLLSVIGWAIEIVLIFILVVFEWRRQ